MPKRPSDPHKRRIIALDKQYLAWLREQPSAYSGKFSEWHDGKGYSVPCHVRRAGEAGVAFKPLFRAISLTDQEHRLTHQHGESALMAPEWFEEAASRHLQSWLCMIAREDAKRVEDFLQPKTLSS